MANTGGVHNFNVFILPVQLFNAILVVWLLLFLLSLIVRHDGTKTRVGDVPHNIKALLQTILLDP